MHQKKGSNNGSYRRLGLYMFIMGVSPASRRQRPFTALDDEQGARDMYGRFPLLREVFFSFLTMTTRTEYIINFYGTFLFFRFNVVLV